MSVTFAGYGPVLLNSTVERERLIKGWPLREGERVTQRQGSIACGLTIEPFRYWQARLYETLGMTAKANACILAVLLSSHHTTPLFKIFSRCPIKYSSGIARVKN